MLRKRLIGVVTVRSGLAVQSIGYQRYLPLGKAEYLIENLDRWGVDEILIQVIDRTTNGLGPDMELLAAVATMHISTPLSYAGGIRNAFDAAAVIQAGVERICVDGLIYSKPEELRAISRKVGAQALIVSMPVMVQDNELYRYDYLSRKSLPMTQEFIALCQGDDISEILLTDVVNEGSTQAFNAELVGLASRLEVPLIVFGGITHDKQCADLLSRSEVVAVAVGNSLNYKEHAVQTLKDKLNFPLRPSVYRIGTGGWL
jgi:cyclase